MSILRSPLAGLALGLLLIFAVQLLAVAGLAALAGPGAPTYPFASAAEQKAQMDKAAPSSAKKSEVRRLAANARK